METGPAGIAANTPRELIQSLSEKLKACYIFPEIAEQICIRLQAYLENGTYTPIQQGELLASTLTTHLQEVNQDRHLNVRWYPQPLPDHAGPMFQNQEWLDEQRQQARLDNYGLHKVERLPGNIGYVDIRQFHFASWGGDTAAAAMAFLAHTDRLIIDLRKCIGGDPDMVTFISSYLFGEERVHLNDMYWRDEDATYQYWTLPYVPGKRFPDKPVYVLTSKDTFSGAEEFAYNLKTRQRALLVGETTRGGAHPGTTYRIHAHFEAFIPIGRPINPLTGANWEGCGVTPDIEAAQEQAFEAAYKMALESVLAGSGEAPSRPGQALLEEARTALQALETK
jgi:hypothetical protein